MKILRDILIFFAVLGVVFVVLNVSFSKKIKQQHFCNASDVTLFKVERKGSEIVTVRLIDGDIPYWEVAFGDLKDRANEADFEKLIDVVCRLPYVEEYSQKDLEGGKGEGGMALFGLAPPQYEITLGREKGQNDIHLFFGNDSPSGTEFYMQDSVDPSKVYTVPNRLQKMIFPEFMDVRSRNPFYTIDQQKEFSFEAAGRNYHFKNEDGSGLKEVSGFMTPSEVKELLETMKLFRFRNYFGPFETDQVSEYGLDVPDVTVTVGSQPFLLVLFGGRFYLSQEVGNKSYVLILDHEAPASFYEILKRLNQK